MSDKPMYHAGMRELQDARETRALADRLEAVIVREALSDEDRSFIARCSMLFVATADADGAPDCSYKGGVPGFVQAPDERTLLIPDYDGNGMYRSWGNLRVNPQLGLLFIDFEQPKRLRVNGRACIEPADGGLSGAVFHIRVSIQRIFPNCPRNLHRMQMLGLSEHAPRPGYEPPVPGWKRSEQFCDYLPPRDKAPQR